MAIPTVFTRTMKVVLKVICVKLRVCCKVTCGITPCGFVYGVTKIILVCIKLDLMDYRPRGVGQLPGRIYIKGIHGCSVQVVQLMGLIFVVNLVIPYIKSIVKVRLGSTCDLLIVTTVLIVAIFCRCQVVRLLQGSRRSRKRPWNTPLSSHTVSFPNKVEGDPGQRGRSWERE